MLTFSQPIKVCDVAFARTANHTWPQDFMSLTFTYSFTISQDFCARKGNTTFLYTTWRYWTTQQYNGLEMQLKRFCSPFKGSSPLPIRPFPWCVLKRFYHKNCLTTPTTDKEVSSENTFGISTSFSSVSGPSLSRISSSWRLEPFGFEDKLKQDTRVVWDSLGTTVLRRNMMPLLSDTNKKKWWPTAQVLFCWCFFFLLSVFSVIFFFVDLFQKNLASFRTEYTPTKGK